MFGDLVKLQQASKADSTLSKYQSGWSRWREWTLSERGVPVIPTRPPHIALFLTELCQSAETKGLGCSSIVATIYSIRWAHEAASIQDCPTNNPIVSYDALSKEKEKNKEKNIPCYQGISKPWIRQEFKNRNTRVRWLKAFSMHSIKSGAASSPGCRNISDDL